jgi:GNAT superfamily N-acetyltransferase
MANVLQLRRRLDQRSEIDSVAGIEVRHYLGEQDIPTWLELRHQAFARQRIGVRQWARDDFLAEFVSRWWWQPHCMWLAENIDDAQTAPHAGVPRQLVGTVTLAMRGEAHQSAQAHPAVHWLMVRPAWRRRGIGRLLMAHLEAAAWDAGRREIWLETHAAWEAAVKFYQSMGYRESQKEESR